METLQMNGAIQTCRRCFLVLLFIVFNFASHAAQLVTAAGASFAPKSGGSGDSGLAIISKDGRYVLFASTANNLTLTNNNNFVLPCRFNVFLRDNLANTTTLVSVNQNGTGGGNGDSFPAGISTNGQFALFESSASDLVANDTNGVTDIFVRDVINGTTTLVSVNATGGSALASASDVANDLARVKGVSRGSVMTPDGRYVAFASSATNLVANDTNGIADIFVRDLQAGTTTLASVGTLTNANTFYFLGAITSSESPEITPDGRYVVFYSTATNLIPGVMTTGEIYVRDLAGGNTVWASTNALAVFKSTIGSANVGNTNVISFNYSISDDGQFVAFEVFTNPAIGFSAHGIILRYNLQTGLTDIISTNACEQLFSAELIHDLALTPDGRFVAYVTGNSTTNSIYCWDAQSGANTLVSVSTDNSTPASGASDSPVISANGQFVAFTSTGTNLVANALTGGNHIYLRDLVNGVTQILDTDTNGVGVGVEATTVPAMSADGSVVAFDSANLLSDNRHLVHDVFTRNVPSSVTTLISAANPSLPSQTPDGISGFTSFSASASGQFVAFYSDADDLVAGDTNGFRDVFARDLVAGVNYLASASTNGGCADGISTDPAISGDGRYVAFTSSADNLVSGDINGAQDVFVRDLLAGTTTLVSVNTNGIYSGNGDSYSPSISANGRYVLFRSKASNLAAGSFTFGSGTDNAFFRDLQTGVTYPLTTSGTSSAWMTPDGQSVAYVSGTLYVWNSQTAARTYTNSSASTVLAISANGQKIAYGSGGSVYVADLVANTSTLIISNPTLAGNFRFSNDGHFLTCFNQAGVKNIYLYDLLAGTNLLVSQNFNQTGAVTNDSDSCAISPDGNFIAYRSFAGNVVANDSNNVADLFIFDRANGATTLVSLNGAGNASADDRSLKPVFSGDGQTLFFESWASDLAGNDFNDGSDLFALNLAALPGGAGTTNSAAAFYARFSPAGGFGLNKLNPLISWPAVSGKTNQVQFKDDLSDPVWQILPGNVTIIGTNGYLDDALPASGQRFYRIILTP